MLQVELPIPAHFRPDRVGEVWRVPYQRRAAEAEKWAKEHALQPAAHDALRICLLAVDVQNTFCIPDFELFVGGRSGVAAVEDNVRLCEFVYRNLGLITKILPTLDTHQAMQIFHSIFLIDEHGEHPAPFTLVTLQDLENGKWTFNSQLAEMLGFEGGEGQRHLRHYARKLAQGRKYDLTIWPYHGMLGGIGHALVSAFEEATFFHSLARLSRPEMQVKGNHPLTENYSALSPEVLSAATGEAIAEKNSALLARLFEHDVLIIAGQAKSHCVAWTVSDLLAQAEHAGKRLADRVYVLEDCMSPVVVPGVIDYTEQADKDLAGFAEAGVHLVRSTDSISNWPGIRI